MEVKAKQPEFIQAMWNQAIYPHPVEEISLRETHISWVFLTGEFVYKLKKPVDLGFLDFTALEKREYFCRREVELNQRLTTDVYLGVVAVTTDGNDFELDGDGRVVEYAVKIKQLSPEDSLENRLADETIDNVTIDLLAVTLTRFYQSAETGSEIDEFGSTENIGKNIEDNFTALSDAPSDALDHRRLHIVHAASRGFFENNQALFQKRVKDNWIRDCHGDLRTDHVYFTDEGIQIIDCIEFNQRFRYSDVACDLAFLAMEMDFKGYPRVAGLFVAAYLKHSDDQAIFSILDFYKCYRAMVRIKVNYLRLRQNNLDPEQKQELRAGISRYLALAYRYAIQFSRPMLWVMCGMIATGKSTVAGALADSLGISVIRSDVVRKQLFDNSPQDNTGEAGFEKEMYTPEATALTYGRLLLQAQEKIRKSGSVVLDATFSREVNRREVLRLAEEMGALIVFVECVCSESTIRKRLSSREEDESLSDARIQHLEDFKARFQKPEELSSQCRIRINTDNNCLEENLRTIFMYIATPKDCLERGWLHSRQF